MPFNYSDAPPPRDFELIPHPTVATCILHINAGGVGEDGMLKRSKDGTCEMLACEFTVIDGLYKGRKFWEYWVMVGTTDGHKQSVGWNQGMIKAIIDSALGLKPDDMGPQAYAARNLSYKQLEGLTFIGKIGVEKGKPKNDNSGENWPDKNILLGVITPDKKDWHPVEQPPPFNGGGSGAQAAAPSSAAPPTPAARWGRQGRLS